jgi:hypothetical protein
MQFMKTFQRLVLAMAVAATAAAPAWSAGFPDKPVKILVGFAPGGANDIIARLIAKELSTAWGQSVVVENKPGANGAIAFQQVAKSPADGYTLALGTAGPTTMNQALQKLPFDAPHSPPAQRIRHLHPVELVLQRVEGVVADLAAVAQSEQASSPIQAGGLQRGRYAASYSAEMHAGRLAAGDLPRRTLKFLRTRSAAGEPAAGSCAKRGLQHALARQQFASSRHRVAVVQVQRAQQRLQREALEQQRAEHDRERGQHDQVARRKALRAAPAPRPG